MSGKIVVTGFLFVAFAFFLLAVLFNLYPPAANSPWTLLGAAAYAVVATVVTWRMARRG